MDLSKAFITINHYLYIAKLHVYGFSKELLKQIKSYLTNRQQRTKLNTGCSDWAEILLGVPQEPALGTLLFNIYINNFFSQLKTLTFLTMPTMQHFMYSDLHNLISSLDHDFVLAIEWFERNYMKLNQDKCHLLISGHKYESV